MTSDVFMIGGANGSGKTTEAMTLLKQKYILDVYEFVNADEIAKGLNPIKPDTANIMATRLMIKRMQELIEAKKNFAFETTCAVHTHIRTLQKCKQAGYRLHLIFLWLPSADMAVRRVAQRVKQGGHSIPEIDIRRRYVNGLRNMVKTYLPMVEKALIIDNSGKTIIDKDSYPVIAEKTGSEFIITNPIAWQQIKRMADENGG